MKKLIIIIIAIGICMFHANAQEPVKKNNSSIRKNVRPIGQAKLPVTTRPIPRVGEKSRCAANPNILSPCALSLLKTFITLSAGTGVRNCHPTLNYPSISSSMPENCFSLQSTSTATVTFTSFYMPRSDLFRVIWGGAPGNFSYYGACAPDPIIFPHPGTTENHVFEARLIKQSDYRAFTGTRTYPAMATVAAIRVSDIQQITDISIEEKTGYIGTHEEAQYNDMLSSKGIVAKVKLRTGATVLCYVINNYDGAGTINWKVRNPACK